MRAPFHEVPRGPRLVCLGLVVVVLALLWPAIPIASAVALIGWGSTLCLRQSNPERQLVLGVLHAAVYGSLACLAGGAQLDRTSSSSGGLAELVALVDLALAIVLVIALTKHIVDRFATTSETQR